MQRLIPFSATCKLAFVKNKKQKKHDTIQRLQNVLMTLENAKLYKQDVYALIVDFTSAFNTIDHDKLLIIMFDLGFPIDTIDVV
jgi:hypothetical protein